jgi:hypothetical protein
MPITISGSTGIAGVDGSASTPAVQGTDTNTGIFFPAADTIAFGEGGSEAMRIDSSGNVGIGTSSPVGRFASVGGSIQLSGGTTSQAGLRVQYASSVATITGINNDNSAFNPLAFYTGASEAMRINTSGNLLVGTTTINSGRINTATANGLYGLVIRDVQVNGAMILFENSSGTIVGQITSNATNTAYNTSSDYRLKHDVKPMVSGLSTVSALKPCIYKWNANNSYGEGFIAHELQAVIPQAVTGEKDAMNDDGSIKPQGVDYSKIVVHLVAAIQELKADFDAYKAAHP